MATPLYPKGEAQSESVMAALLRSGVVLAAVVVLVGAVFYLVRHGMSSPDYRVFRGEPSDLRNLRGILGDAASLHGRGIIQLGLMFLVATPITRVAFSILVFLRERDLLYTLITTFVLCLLIYSIIGAGHL
jgi:uncharacterized membrane protein